MLLIVVALVLGGGVAFSLIYHPQWGNEITEVVQRWSTELPVSVLPKKENAPDWQREERINILLLGIDRRPDEANAPTRTDTMLIATLDPAGKTAGLLSIPRDLWTDIPLKDGSIIQDRINTAYFHGDLYRYPGGGPALAMEAVRYNLGIKIHYYAVIDFDGFEKMIDTLGGVTIELKKPLIDPEFPTPDYGTMNIYIPGGIQHLNGEKALWYARSRYQDGDVGRMRHQQELLLAIRDRVLQLGIIPKVPNLIGQFGSTFKTNLSISEIMRLAALAREIEAENILCRSFDMNYATVTITPGGADVLVLDRQKAKTLINEMFFDPRIRKEEASILVLNGTAKPGVAAKVASFLRGQGLAPVNTGNADSFTYKETLIYDYAGKRYTANFLADALGIPSSRVKAKTGSPSEADLYVILGEDARIPNN